MLYLTFGGGLVFLLVKSWEWSEKISHGHTLSSSTFFSFYYTAAGLHAAESRIVPSDQRTFCNKEDS